MGAGAQDSADQDVSPNVSVADRFAGNFGADGVQMGAFTVFPTLSYTQIYDDNIFSLETAKVDDFIADVFGGLRIASDWSVHGVELTGTVRRLQYFENSDESTTDYTAGGRLFFDLPSRSRVTFSATHRRGTEARRVTQTAIGAATPVRFETNRAAVDFDIRQSRFREQFGVSFTQDDFDDAALMGGGVIDQDFRDRDVYRGYFRQFVRLRPAVSAFVQVDGEIQEYEFPQVTSGAFQDSQSYGAQFGLAFDINKVARGEIGAGYQKRDYDDPVFEDVSGLNVAADFEFFMSDLTTITIGADRSIRDSAVVGIGGYYSSGGDITIEHELFRPVILVGTASYRIDNFRDPSVDRQDEVLRFSVGADYAFRRSVVAGLRYIYIDVSSTGADARAGFSESIVRFGVEFRM